MAEAEKYSRKFLVHDETVDGRLIESWEEVSRETVMTPREAYNLMAQSVRAAAKQGAPRIFLTSFALGLPCVVRAHSDNRRAGARGEGARCADRLTVSHV